MRKIKKSNLGTVAIVVAVIALVIFSELIFCFNDTEYIVTITGRERITESSRDGDGNTRISSKYLVFADDENGESLVFENTDCFIRWKFNSSNIQGQLKEWHTYKITVIGYRVPFLSWYQNIIKVEEITGE